MSKRLLSVLVSGALVLAPLMASAQASPVGGTPFGSKYLNLVGSQSSVSGLSSTSFPVVVANLINVIIGLLGIVLLAYLLWAGFLWMTAGGEEKQVVRSKEMIKQAVIGLVIVTSAFAISNFVINRLNFVVTGTATP